MVNISGPSLRLQAYGKWGSEVTRGLIWANRAVPQSLTLSSQSPDYLESQMEMWLNT